MKNQKTFLILIGVIIVILGLAGYLLYQQYGKTSNQTDNSQSSNWNTYSDQYGFSFDYPSSLKPDNQGENEAQKQLDAGQQISGTVTPSYETVYFRDSTNKAKFQVDVFHVTDKTLTVNNYQSYFYTSGTCDLRYLDAKPSVTVMQQNNLSFVQVDATVGGQPRSCFYLKNNVNNLIAISMLAPDNQSDYNNTKQIIQRMLSTFKFATTTNVPLGGFHCNAYTNFSDVANYLKKNNVQIPVLLPTQLPESYTNLPPSAGRLYLSYGVSDIGDYSVAMSLGFNVPNYDCQAADSNAMGVFMANGSTLGIPQYFEDGEKITLARGIQGYYSETGRNPDANINWMYKGIYYQAISLHMSKAEAITTVNSAINNAQ